MRIRVAVVLAFLVALLPRIGAPAVTLNGSSYGLATTSEILAEPFSISCMAWADNTSTLMTIASLGNTAADNYFRIAFLGSGSPGVIAVSRSSSPDAGGLATSSTAYSANTWHVVTGVFSSDTSRAVYLDGAGKGTDTTSTNVSNQTRTAIGTNAAANTVSQHITGRVAECGIWSVALSDDDAAMLGARFAPPCVRRDALVGYYPLPVEVLTTLKDLFTATSTNLTLTGGTASTHPRVINCQ